MFADRRHEAVFQSSSFVSGANCMARQIKKSRTAIIIEDDRAMGDLVNKMLLRLGYNTFVCFDYESATEFFNPNLIDLFVADIFTSGMGGIEGIKKIRDVFPDTQIIAMSGGWDSMPAEKSGLAARKIGVNYFLQKPFTFKDMEMALESHSAA